MPDFWWLPLAAGPFIGSFLGVVIQRLPEERPIALARSACDTCGATLDAQDLIPIGSFIMLRGKCRRCGSPIAPFHLAVELAATGIAAVAVLLDTDGQMVWVDCGLGWTLLTLAWIDARHMRLPDVLTLPLLVAGLCVALWFERDLILWHALGAIGGYAAFRLISVIYYRLRGVDGLGEGDAKLMAAGGAWLGLAALPYVAMVAALIGIGLIIFMARAGRTVTAKTAIPFGPPLAGAIWLAWLFRDWMI